MDWDKMINLYRTPSIDAFYQALVHLAKQFQRKIFFRNQSIRNKNCLWWPCLLMDWDEMSNRSRGLSIDTSTKLRFIWINGFRREESKKSANKKHEQRVVAMFVNGSGLDEQSFQRTFHRCSYHVSDQVVSDKIFLEINQSEKIIACGGHICKWIGTK